MRRTYNLLFSRPALFLILFICTSSLEAQTSKGRTFWVTFMESIGSPDTIQELKIVIACDQAASGTIQNYTSGKTQNFFIGSGGGMDTVLLPASMCYNTGSESSSTRNRGILIQSNNEVSVSAQNSKPGSCDAALIYPVEALGSYYRIVSHKGDQGGSNMNYRSCFVIVASENNTVIDITPSVDTDKGNLAGTLFSVTLQKGETYQVKSSTHRLDLSGTLVQSRDCKNIAVFAGSTRSSVLNGSCSPSYSHLYEQMVPVNYWATKFIAIPSIYAKGKQRRAEMIKVVANLNSTTVRCNGKLKIMSAGQSDTFFITTDAVIVSNKPIGVCQFALSEGCDSPSTSTSPYMLWVPSVEQAEDSVSFAVENAVSVNNIFMNIIARTSATNTLKLDGTVANLSWQKVMKDTNYSYTRLDSLPRGKHRITCDGGIMSSTYAYGNHGSYGYVSGTSTNPLDFHGTVNGKNIRDVAPGAIVAKACQNAAVSFEALVSYSGTLNWKWIIYDSSGTIVKTVNNFFYTFRHAGDFEIALIAQRPTPGLCNGLTSLDDTLRTKITITPKPGFKLQAGKSVVCKDSAISIFAKDINWKKASFSFWTFNTGDTLWNDSVITRTVSLPGTFIFTLYDNIQCVNRDTITIDPRNHPNVSLPASASICSGDSILLRPLVFPYFNPKVIQWRLDTFLLPNKDFFYMFKQSTSANITFNITDPYGCSGYASSFINVFPKPSVSIVSQVNYHYTDTVVLKTDKPFAIYSWFNGHNTAINRFAASVLGSPGKYAVWCMVVDSNGCVGHDTMDIFTDKLSVSPVGHEQIKVYPNPAGNLVNIELPAGSDLIIYSMDGKTISRQTLKHGLNSIDIADLETGLYVLEIGGTRKMLIKE